MLISTNSQLECLLEVKFSNVISKSETVSSLLLHWLVITNVILFNFIHYWLIFHGCIQIPLLAQIMKSSTGHYDLAGFLWADSGFPKENVKPALPLVNTSFNHTSDPLVCPARMIGTTLIKAKIALSNKSKLHSTISTQEHDE